MQSTIAIRPKVSYGLVRPEVYGHFAEHLGRCIYEGLWVGENSAIPNHGGIRDDTIAALAHIGTPLLRWPGGCFADAYHWEDGIGPRDARPKRPNHWWENEDSNAYGTNEYFETCERIGTEPFICLNVGTGTPQEALAWVKYCTYGGDTSYTRLRKAAGRLEPWKIRYWAVGNENCGCGGRFKAKDYAREYRRFTSYLKQTAPHGEFVVCGFDQKWNVEVLEELRDDLAYVDHISIHKYVTRGKGAEFSNNEYWLLMQDVAAVEDVILMTAGTVQSYTQYPKRSIGIALDEWGVWHTDTTVAEGHLQHNTLRDAIFAASSFHMFHRHASVLSMTNIAQTINVLQCLLVTDGAKLSCTPTYHVYDLFQPHKGAEAVVTDADGPSVEVFEGTQRHSIEVLDASATMKADGSLTLSVVNRHPTESQEARIGAEGRILRTATARHLGGLPSETENMPGTPEIVSPTDTPVTLRDGEIVHVFPPCSVTVFRLA